MPINYSNAIDEILGMVNACWQASDGIVGYVPEIRWPGAQKATKPELDKFWIRVSTQIVNEGQASLANHDGVRKFHAVGLLYVQVFAPRTVAGAKENGRALGELVKNAFRSDSPSGAIWFRDQKIVELGEESTWHPFNVIVTFEYDDTGVVTPALVLPGQSGKVTRHFAIEPCDGVRTEFTFVGIPASGSLMFLNGIVNDPDSIVGDIITITPAPAATDSLFALY